MRVLLTPIGSAGDTLPFIGLGRELARRGHDVTIAASAPFAGQIRDAKLGFVRTATDEEYRLAADDPNLFHPLKGFAAVMEHVAEYNRRMFDIVASARRRGRRRAFARIRIACDRGQDRPARRAGLSATVDPAHELRAAGDVRNESFLPRWARRALWRLVDRVMLDPPTAPFVNEMRARLGLAPVDRIFVSQIGSPLLNVAMFPEWFAPRQPDWPANLVQCDFPL